MSLGNITYYFLVACTRVEKPEEKFENLDLKICNKIGNSILVATYWVEFSDYNKKLLLELKNICSECTHVETPEEKFENFQ